MVKHVLPKMNLFYQGKPLVMSFDKVIEPKRGEAGENPARSRHCEPGLLAIGH
jgi:hypothetical protein